ncbi:cell division protein PerM [Streptomyces triticagri]|uniref:cell division protein PerM n=1 Tax=Streptomyces triticagri TaxID=2293568 RepID=UPI001314824F|nr:DUF6350 family protein [Streptomyces triticagri]
MRNTTDRAARRAQDRSSAPVRGARTSGPGERPRQRAAADAAPAPVITSTTVFAALAARRRASAIARCVYGGVLAAALGLGSLAVLVIMLWISSPYPDSGPGGALRAAAGLWLLAHGAELVRPDTLSGVPAPIGLTPLLLVLLVVWPLHRAARDAVDTAGEVRSALWGVVAGYLLVAGGATLFAAGGPLPAAAGSAALHVPVLTVASAAAGVWSAYGRPRGPLPWVPRHRWSRLDGRAEAGVRAGLAAALVLVAGGAVLVTVSLVRSAGDLQDSFGGLSGVWSGRFAVLLLALALVPNAAVWGAAYALGPGFSLGSGRTVAPLGELPDTLLPSFPLLTAVPSTAGGAAVFWSACAVPLIAGLTLAWFTAAAARGAGAGPGRTQGAAGAEDGALWTAGATALVAGAGALLCGVLCALLARIAGGPLGSAGLADFGPVWWQTGLAALAWTAVIGVPGALGLRGLRVWRVNRRVRRAEAMAGSAVAPEAAPESGSPGAPDSAGTAPVGVVPAAARSALGASRTWIARIRGTRTQHGAAPWSPVPTDPAPAPPTSSAVEAPAPADRPAQSRLARLRSTFRLPSRRSEQTPAAPTGEDSKAASDEAARTPRRWWPLRRRAARPSPPANAFEPYDFLPPDGSVLDPSTTAPRSPEPVPAHPPRTSPAPPTKDERADRP